MGSQVKNGNSELIKASALEILALQTVSCPFEVGEKRVECVNAGQENSRPLYRWKSQRQTSACKWSLTPHAGGQLKVNMLAAGWRMEDACTEMEDLSACTGRCGTASLLL